MGSDFSGALDNWLRQPRVACDGGLVGVPCSLYRGATSKGPVFFGPDLPESGELRDRFLLAALNPDHPGQIDGIGGAESLSNKVAIVRPSDRPDADVNYEFVQLSPGSRLVHSETGTSGNFGSCVGPYAVEQGLVTATADQTEVSIYATDSHMLIRSRVQTPGGKVTYQGRTRIDGVAGTSAPIEIAYETPFGTRTGGHQATPTGSRCNEVDGVPVTVINAGGAITMFLAAASVDRTGYESKEQLDNDHELAARIESVRKRVAAYMGMGDVSEDISPGVAMLAPPRFGGTITSRKLWTLAASTAHCHASHSGSGGICLAVACILPGTVAHTLASTTFDNGKHLIEIEHPSGKLPLTAYMSHSGDEESLSAVSLVRTCRKLFDGRLFAPIEALTN